MKRLLAIATALAVSAFGMAGISAAPASAETCRAETVIGIGGVGDGDASAFEAPGAVDIRVPYSGGLNDIEGGIRELDKTVANVRAACPETTLGFAGMSQGSVIVHVYLQRKGPMLVGNAWYVAYADPKQEHTGQSDALFRIVGPPTAGTDANFGGVPGVSICYIDDVICNKNAKSGWIGYSFAGTHTEHYDFLPKLHKHQRGILWV